MKTFGLILKISGYFSIFLSIMISTTIGIFCLIGECDSESSVRTYISLSLIGTCIFILRKILLSFFPEMYPKRNKVCNIESKQFINKLKNKKNGS